MTVTAWIAAGVAGWLVVAAVTGVVVGRGMRRRDAQSRADFARASDEAVDLMAERRVRRG